ncbi:hypothetical protein LTR86_008592 [Recurvomyces mirabilis]|nr:hypothetical protein LTR86_008592 [Recurvomyces mirabilis]
MDDSTQPTAGCSKQAADPFHDWVDFDAQDEGLSPLDGMSEYFAGNTSSTTTSPTDRNTNVDASPSQIYADWLDALPSPQQQSAGSGVTSEGKRLSDKRREQNRAS